VRSLCKDAITASVPRGNAGKKKPTDDVPGTHHGRILPNISPYPGVRHRSVFQGFNSLPTSSLVWCSYQRSWGEFPPGIQIIWMWRPTGGLRAVYPITTGVQRSCFRSFDSPVCNADSKSHYARSPSNADT